MDGFVLTILMVKEKAMNRTEALIHLLAIRDFVQAEWLELVENFYQEPDKEYVEEKFCSDVANMFKPVIEFIKGEDNG